MQVKPITILSISATDVPTDDIYDTLVQLASLKDDDQPHAESFIITLKVLDTYYTDMIDDIEKGFCTSSDKEFLFIEGLVFLLRGTNNTSLAVIHQDDSIFS